MTLTLKNTNPETKGKLNVSNNKFCRNYSISSNDCQPRRLILETSLSFKNLVIQDFEKQVSVDTTTKHSDTSNILLTQARIIPEPASVVFSPRVLSPQDVAATKVQKVYKSYRTRRNLADGAVLIEELWWKTLDSASLEKSSVLFFDTEKPETAASKWARATTRAAKVGKGLLKDDKAQKLALQHWLEAIDPRHRYGHNLRLYYDIWFISESAQPFFYWLDVGDGKEINLEKCPRMKLQHQCIKYLGPKERESYEVVVENGKLVYKNSGIFVSTNEGSKWIFVLSTSRALYIGQKTKGTFQHSSFLSGAAITAAGRLVAHGGVLEAIWPYSGHYHPTEENFREFISFLEENSVDLSSVKKCSIDDDHILYIADGEESNQSESQFTSISGRNDLPINKQATTATNYDKNDKKTDDECMEAPVFDIAKHIPHKWSTGAGPRIRCLMDYPAELQSRALEQVNLSPRLAVAPPYNTYGPIPSPRPSPRVHLSPRLAYGHMSPPPASSSSSIAKCKYVAK